MSRYLPSRGLTARTHSCLMPGEGCEGSAQRISSGPQNSTTHTKTNMKKILFTLTLIVAFILGDQAAFAQAKKKPAIPEDPTTAVTDKAKAAADTAKAAAEKPKAAVEAAKPKKETFPMYLRADEIDAKAMTITQVNKDGHKSVNTVTSKTEIMNSGAAAKFGDIKVGDWVGGIRKKTAEHAYEVEKITKFGAKTEKPAGEPKKKQ